MAEVPSPAEFATRYPAFEAASLATLQAAIDDAASSVSVSALGEREWRRAVMLLAAHELTLIGVGEGMEAALLRQGLGGFSSVSDGALSASRPVATSTGDYYDSTSYGRQYRALIRRVGPRISVAAPADSGLRPLGPPVWRRW